jgi:acyl-CoA dehydrogenase
MDFAFSPEQIELRRRARDFVQREIAPFADALDETYAFPSEAVGRIKASGFFRYVVPTEYGGEGISSVTLCILREEFAKVSTNADEIFIMQGLGGYPIVRFGNDAQKGKYLPSLADGSKLVNFCLTEPGAGSDAAAIQTGARRDGDVYRLTGRKCFMSKPAHTELSVVFAKTDPAAGGKGMSAFVVDRAESRYEVNTDRLVYECNIGEIIMEDMAVPRMNLLGEEGDGMRIALSNLGVFRPTVGAAALGMAARALSLALDRARHRRMFGQRLSDFQVTQFKLAEMKVELDAARLLVYRAAWLADTVPERTSLESSAAKYYATEAAQRVVDRALQMHGGIGLHKKSRIEHLYRAVRAPRIYEGASEIQLLVIGRELMRLDALEHDERL